MTRNLVLLFAALFIVLTALDLATTWVGVNQMGYAETNPYSDLSSVQGLVIPEIITLAICMAMVAFGTYRRKTTLSSICQESFITYAKTMFSRKHVLMFGVLVFAPILLALLRSVAVFNNTLLIVTGYGLFVDEEFSLLSRNQLVLTISGLLLIRPTNYLIYRVCRASA